MINILYTGNDYVFKGIMLSVLSVIKHTNKDIHVYIVSMDIDNYKAINSDMVSILEKTIKEKNPNNEVTLINITDLFVNEMKDSKNINNFYTPYCLIRLFSDLLDLPSKILYLDTDTMINKDIDELFSIDITNYEFAGVVDRLGRFFIDKNYINSGVLLLNLDMIRKTELFKKTRELVKTKKMAFPDQSALNKLKQYYLKIPSKYNSQRYLKKDTVVKHFCKSIRWLPIYHTINVKQWEVKSVHKRLKIHAYDDLYKKYEEITGEELC